MQLVLTRPSQFMSFAEICKQNETSLRVTAALLDELTEGLVIAQIFDLWEWDCAQFLAERFHIPMPTGVCQWAKVGQIHANESPSMVCNTTFNGIDRLWNMTFQEVFDCYEWQMRQPMNIDIEDDVLAEVVIYKDSQLAAKQKRKQVRINEFEIFLQKWLKPVFGRHLAIWNRQRGFAGGQAGSLQQYVAVTEVLVTAMNSFKDGKLGAHLPTAALLVELYALYESSRDRRPPPKLKNDWFDWNHAAVALPRCNFFFTESNLAHLLQQELRADLQYECKVASRMSEALEVLRKS